MAVSQRHTVVIIVASRTPLLPVAPAHVADNYDEALVPRGGCRTANASVTSSVRSRNR
jgi:hypothetical protein